MTLREQVLNDALALPHEDRAFVVAALERSLKPAAPEDLPDAVSATDPSAVAGEEFLLELQRRSAAYRTGATTSRSLADALEDQRRKQAGEAMK